MATPCSKEETYHNIKQSIFISSVKDTSPDLPNGWWPSWIQHDNHTNLVKTYVAVNPLLVDNNLTFFPQSDKQSDKLV